MGDSQNGYPASHARLMQHSYEAQAANAVAIDFDNERSPMVATDGMALQVSVY